MNLAFALVAVVSVLLALLLSFDDNWVLVLFVVMFLLPWIWLAQTYRMLDCQKTNSLLLVDGAWHCRFSQAHPWQSIEPPKLLWCDSALIVMVYRVGGYRGHQYFYLTPRCSDVRLFRQLLCQIRFDAFADVLGRTAL
ncbi:Uncharacterised protein [BD1-7 clade bacterium]|uniref:Uncharacterized protein n=1 Tax=BD1-7 clade bacterium TaxID=2029982 RepID=A0A5S9P9Q2_9GAMM|nr:Uncharacterised protein [BD1-7 clade bacterium]CAA0116034.1 Uncharacterised protein [BD1-7 clade bacterium]